MMTNTINAHLLNLNRAGKLAAVMFEAHGPDKADMEPICYVTEGEFHQLPGCPQFFTADQGLALLDAIIASGDKTTCDDTDFAAGAARRVTVSDFRVS